MMGEDLGAAAARMRSPSNEFRVVYAHHLRHEPCYTCSLMPRFFGSRTVLEFVEGAAELFFFLQHFGELDAQVGGFGFYLGEAEC